MTTNTDDICEKYLELTNAASLYRDKWICDESLLRLLISNYPNLKGTLRSSVVGKLRTITGRFDSSNTNRLYSAKFKVLCPVEQSARRNVHFWYRDSEDKPPPLAPKRSSDVACAFANSPSVKRDTIRTNTAIRDLLKSQQPKNATTPPPAPLRSGKERLDPTPQHTKKQKKRASVVEETPRDNNKSVAPPEEANEASPENKTNDDNDSGESPAGVGDGGNISGAEVQSDGYLIPIYWESSQAAKLFGFNYDAGDDGVEVLTKAVQSFKGYKDVVVTHNGAQLSEFALFNIRNKCIYLRKVYEIALKKMGRFDERYGEYVMNFLKVPCQEAVDACNELGLCTTINARTLSNWNVEFRTQN